MMFSLTSHDVYCNCDVNTIFYLFICLDVVHDNESDGKNNKNPSVVDPIRLLQYIIIIIRIG